MDGQKSHLSGKFNNIFLKEIINNLIFLICCKNIIKIISSNFKILEFNLLKSNKLKYILIKKLKYINLGEIL